MSQKRFHPDEPLNCLIVQPAFSMFSFWNYSTSAATIGAKTPSPPLGLLTVAAILPQHWTYRLLDLNCRDFCATDWAWADLVITGGMLPQQKGLLEVVRRAKKDGKFIAIGGSDPSSQPEVYADADMVAVGEGEDVIPRWLASWRAGEPRGIFREVEKPDVTTTPVPRWDLIRFGDYVQMGVQYSRGCPFNCEFCDIIELFGRKPRTKNPEQILAEFSRLKALGYAGPIDIVDDNLIGNKRSVKRGLLPAIISWNKANGYPFWYNTEASMNLMDDDDLMEQMREAGFVYVFMGIETPDPEVLLRTQKSQNTVKPIVERVRRLYDFGMIPTAGFIMGFDGEKAGVDQSIIKLIEDCHINMAMVGLLVALPKTQLTRRLLREGRLLSFKGEPVNTEGELMASARMDHAMVEVVDQTLAGLNYITTRDRIDIFREFRNVVETVYEPRRYFDRVMRVARAMRPRSRHRPNLFELRRNLRGFVRASIMLSSDRRTRWLWWRNILQLIPMGQARFEQACRLMGIYIHFRKQVPYLLDQLDQQIRSQLAMPPEIRKAVHPVAARTAIEAAEAPVPSAPQAV